ncbi:MAG: hypothetical protein J0M12_06630 [Deltaproteobacteria bacterium]|nr:hypothetical protein [Deltaproteobacteria bacterium]
MKATSLSAHAAPQPTPAHGEFELASAVSPLRSAQEILSVVERFESTAGGPKASKLVEPELAWKILRVIGIERNDNAFEMSADEIRERVPEILRPAAARAFFSAANGLFRIDASAKRVDLAAQSGDSQGGFLLSEQAFTLHPEARYLKYMLICAQHNHKSNLAYLGESPQETEDEILEELESSAEAGIHFLEKNLGLIPGLGLSSWRTPTLTPEYRTLVGNVARTISRISEYYEVEVTRDPQSYFAHGRELALHALKSLGLPPGPQALSAIAPAWANSRAGDPQAVREAAWLTDTVGTIEYNRGFLRDAYIYFRLAITLRPDWNNGAGMMRQIERERPGTRAEARRVLGLA